MNLNFNANSFNLKIAGIAKWVFNNAEGLSVGVCPDGRLWVIDRGSEASVHVGCFQNFEALKEGSTLGDASNFDVDSDAFEEIREALSHA